MTFASSMKTAAGPLKARRATSETPTLRMSSRNFTFLRRAPFSQLSVRSRGAELIDLPRRGRGNPLVLSWPRHVAPGDASRRSQGRRTRGKSKSKETKAAFDAGAYIPPRSREKKMRAAKKGKRREREREKRIQREKKERKSKTDESGGKQKRTKARARDGGGLKNDIHRETK